jgi:plasmid replication initiation protein
MERRSRLDDAEPIGAALEASLRRLEANVKARAAAEKQAVDSKALAPITAPASAKGANLRTPPEGDVQPDFFVPSLFDIPVKDGVDLMDVAVFRLSKSQTRRGDIIRYELSDAIIEVAGGAHGMATIWDYDLVLMMVSHLADATRRHRAGRGPKPTNRFRPHAVEILKFCRLPDGGQQYENLAHTLDRLQGTFIKITHTQSSTRKRRTGYFPLIAGADVVSRTDSGKVGQVEIVIPDWIFDGVCNHKTPEVLTVDPDYLLIRGGLARFVYRLARKAAGKSSARYSFRTIHQRSGSTREFKKFAHDLRELVKANDLPGYALDEDKGADGPMLLMSRRDQALEADA